MNLQDKDIIFILDRVTGKISSSSFQTHPNFREDLKQELKLMIVDKIKSRKIDYDVPGFFEYLKKHEDGKRL